jgi:hypothetical protein
MFTITIHKCSQEGRFIPAYPKKMATQFTVSGGKPPFLTALLDGRCCGFEINFIMASIVSKSLYSHSISADGLSFGFLIQSNADTNDTLS